MQLQKHEQKYLNRVNQGRSAVVVMQYSNCN